MSSVSGSPETTWYSSVSPDPVPNGSLPVAANARTAPRLKMSLGGPASRPWACSGDMNPGEPITIPVRVSALESMDREIPKSISRGPSSASSTFDGFRSRCTSPAEWMATSPSARPTASISTTPGDNGPWASTSAAREGPAT